MPKVRMRAQTGLVRRGGIWWFRRRIPKDLVTHFAPKREQIFSLRTADRTEAERLARLRAVELDHEYTAIRAQIAKTQRPLSDEDIRRLSALYVTWVLGEDERIRQSGLNDEQFRVNADQLEVELENSRAAVARGKVEGGISAMVDAFLAEQGISIDSASESYKRLSYEIAKADVRALSIMKARDNGEVLDTPEAPNVRDIVVRTPRPRKQDASAKGSLEDLRDYWKRQKKPRPKTVIEADSVLRRFREVNGALAPANVTRRHVVAFRDALVDQGKAPGTVKKLVGLLGGMFQVAVEDERFGVETNPCRDVKIRGALGEAKARKPFSIDELNAIFSSPVFTKGKRPTGGAGEAAYWLPLIGLYTGARLNEIGQLHVADVRKQEGVTFLHFTNEGEGQQLKRGGKSRKRVPLHTELVRLGLLRYVERMRSASEERLFPDLRADSHGHVTGRWSRWFNRYLDGVVGISDPSKDFHSFRHTFKLHARSCGIPEDQHDALTGHANASVARSYGSAEGYPLGALKGAIRRLRFRDIRLPSTERAVDSSVTRRKAGRPRS